MERKRRHCAYGLRWVFVNALAMILLAGNVLAAEPVTIVALGDSLTAGLGLKPSDAFPARLEAALKTGGVNARVINAGVSGDTSAGGRARLSWALSGSPHVLIIELGANDGLRGLDPAETKANLDAILTEAKARGLRILLTGMKAPPNLGGEYVARYDALFPDLARKHGVAFYPFFLEGVVARPALNQADGIHPNAAGVAEIVRRLLPHVQALTR